MRAPARLAICSARSSRFTKRLEMPLSSSSGVGGGAAASATASIRVGSLQRMKAADALPDGPVGPRLGDLAALGGRVRAARPEMATARQIGERRRHALDGPQSL